MNIDIIEFWKNKKQDINLFSFFQILQIILSSFALFILVILYTTGKVDTTNNAFRDSTISFFAIFIVSWIGLPLQIYFKYFNVGDLKQTYKIICDQEDFAIAMFIKIFTTILMLLMANLYSIYWLRDLNSIKETSKIEIINYKIAIKLKQEDTSSEIIDNIIESTSEAIKSNFSTDLEINHLDIKNIKSNDKKRTSSNSKKSKTPKTSLNNNKSKNNNKKKTTKSQNNKKT